MLTLTPAGSRNKCVRLRLYEQVLVRILNGLSVIVTKTAGGINSEQYLRLKYKIS
jgi:hypothetical protein